MGEQVIVLTDLTKQYGNFTAVDHIRLHIQKGEIFGLLGPNGAGKSTTILMMLGLTEPTSGSVEICGINSTTHPIEVKRKIGYLPEDKQLETGAKLDIGLDTLTDERTLIEQRL